MCAPSNKKIDDFVSEINNLVVAVEWKGDSSFVTYNGMRVDGFNFLKYISGLEIACALEISLQYVRTPDADKEMFIKDIQNRFLSPLVNKDKTPTTFVAVQRNALSMHRNQIAQSFFVQRLKFSDLLSLSVEGYNEQIRKALLKTITFSTRRSSSLSLQAGSVVIIGSLDHVSIDKYFIPIKEQSIFDAIVAFKEVCMRDFNTQIENIVATRGPSSEPTVPHKELHIPQAALSISIESDKRKFDSKPAVLAWYLLSEKLKPHHYAEFAELYTNGDKGGLKAAVTYANKFFKKSELTDLDVSFLEKTIEFLEYLRDNPERLWKHRTKDELISQIGVLKFKIKD